MKKGMGHYRHAVVLGLAALLAGCGGGGGGGGGLTSTTCTADCVSGRVQTAGGSGISGVYVTATNVLTGQVCSASTSPTSSDGSYVISLSACGGGQAPVVITAPGGEAITIPGTNGSGSGASSSSPSGSSTSTSGAGTGTSSTGSTLPPSDSGAGQSTTSTSSDTSGATSPSGSSSTSIGSGSTTTSSSGTSSSTAAGGAGSSASSTGSTGSSGTGSTAGGTSSVLVNSWAPGQSTTGVDLNPSTTSAVAAFAGAWTASYSPTDPRGDSGTCTLVVSTEGVVSATQPNCVSVKSGPFVLTGTINSSGQFGGGTSTGGSYTGNFTVAQSSASGTWVNGPDGGGWSASKVGP